MTLHPMRGTFQILSHGTLIVTELESNPVRGLIPRKPSYTCVGLAKDALQGSIAKGGLGLRKVSPVPAMPYPSTPCEQATLEMAIGSDMADPSDILESPWSPLAIHPCICPHF
jgi:hypothetical protein